MKQGQDHHLSESAEGFIARLLAWWQRRGELQGLDRHERDRIAADLGMTAHDLEHLAARGPRSAELLYRRLEALGLSKSDVERTAIGLMRDLERTCSCCEHKRVCEHDLAGSPTSSAWKGYCPNASSLEDVAATKGRLSA
jgi:hypothetical protein